MPAAAMGRGREGVDEGEEQTLIKRNETQMEKPTLSALTARASLSSSSLFVDPFDIYYSEFLIPLGSIVLTLNPGLRVIERSSPSRRFHPPDGGVQREFIGRLFSSCLPAYIYPPIGNISDAISAILRNPQSQTIRILNAN